MRAAEPMGMKGGPGQSLEPSEKHLGGPAQRSDQRWLQAIQGVSGDRGLTREEPAITQNSPCKCPLPYRLLAALGLSGAS